MACSQDLSSKQQQAASCIDDVKGFRVLGFNLCCTLWG